MQIVPCSTKAQDCSFAYVETTRQGIIAAAARGITKFIAAAIAITAIEEFTTVALIAITARTTTTTTTMLVAIVNLGLGIVMLIVIKHFRLLLLLKTNSIVAAAFRFKVNLGLEAAKILTKISDSKSILGQHCFLQLITDFKMIFGHLQLH